MSELKGKGGTMSSVQEILNLANEHQQKAGPLGAGTSAPLPISKELYDKLRDPKEQERLAGEFHKTNPGYMLRFNPQRENDGNYSTQLFIYAMQSKEDLVQMVRFSGMSGRTATTLPFHITEQFFNELQNPKSKAEAIAELEKSNPGCKFEFNLNRTSSFGGKSEYMMQIGMRPLDSVKELSDTFGNIMESMNRGFTSPPLSISRELYGQLQDPKARAEMLKKFEEANPGFKAEMSFVNRPPENPLQVQLFASPKEG